MGKEAGEGVGGGGGKILDLSYGLKFFEKYWKKKLLQRHYTFLGLHVWNNFEGKRPIL